MPGRALSAEDLVAELKRLGYREDPRLQGPGTYRLGLGRMELATRGFSFAGDIEPEQLVSIAFVGGRIAALRDSRGSSAAIVRLNPLLIGSLFPSHGEDRLIVAPGDIPPLLTDTLKAVEDRRFDSHFGVDPIAVARALFVNVSAGEIREGASTLTQQLVRSYFLIERAARLVAASCAKRSWPWRSRCATTRATCCTRTSTRSISARTARARSTASGSRASSISANRSPSSSCTSSRCSSPRCAAPRITTRAATPIARSSGATSCCSAWPTKGSQATTRCKKRPISDLGLVGNNRRSATHSAFLGLVRRQLSADYARDDLERTGLVVLSTLDPAVQAAAERALD